MWKYGERVRELYMRVSMGRYVCCAHHYDSSYGTCVFFFLGVHSLFPAAVIAKLIAMVAPKHDDG